MGINLNQVATIEMLETELRTLVCLLHISALGKTIECKILLTHFTKKSIKMWEIK